MEKPVIFTGDIHGEFKSMIYLLKRFQITDLILIQIGGFGVGFASLEYDLQSLTYLSKKLEEFNSPLFFISHFLVFPD
jgi:ABC-type thiamin/hydroxymethylpyrimidine transport system permease subunit